MGDRYETMFNAKYARDYLRYLNPDTTLMYVDNRFWQDELYVSSANKYTLLNDWDVDLSVDYKWNYLNSTLDNFVYPTRHTLLAAVATAYTWHRIKMQASGLFTLVNDRHQSRSNGVTLKHHSSYMRRFMPAVFVSYQPWLQHDLNFRAFYKRIFRMPTFNDLYYTDIGNIRLKPEYATQYNVGFKYQRFFTHGLVNGVKLSADAYYNVITDKIIAVPRGSGQYRWMMMNIGKAKIRGIDASATLALRLPGQVLIDLNASYTYQRAQDYTTPADRGYGGTYKGQIAYIPWHSGSAIVHAAWRDWGLNYSFIYVGERYHTSANIPVNHEEPWYTHDLSANYTWRVGKVKLKLALEVNNLLNQYYDVIVNYPMPGRNYKMTLKLDI